MLFFSREDLLQLLKPVKIEADQESRAERSKVKRKIDKRNRPMSDPATGICLKWNIHKIKYT